MLISQYSSLTFRLTLMTSSKSCSDNFNTKLSLVIPAQLIIQLGGELYFSIIVFKADCTLSVDATFNSTVKCDCVGDFCNDFMASGNVDEQSAAITDAPSLAST